MDPVFQSAVLPYFLHTKREYQVILLTFEKKHLKPTPECIDIIKQTLKEKDIIWYHTSWNSGKFKFIKKVFDLLKGLCYALYLCLVHRVGTIYSEGFPGAVIGHYVSKIARLDHVVHSFEPHADYMIEAGIWKKQDWEARLLRRFELKVAAGASCIVTATDAYATILRNYTSADIYKLPSCVDEQVFKYQKHEAQNIRSKLNWNEDIVITYLGKIGGMYLDKEMFRFFRFCEQYIGANFKFLILTSDGEIVKSRVQQYAIDPNNYHITFVKRQEVPGYLSTADFGFVGVQPYPSKRYCSPIKVGEYWSCGVPILIFKDISDDYLHTRDENLGIVVSDTSDSSLKVMIKRMVQMYQDKTFYEQVRYNCRAFVIKDRSISKAHILYNEIFSK